MSRAVRYFISTSVKQWHFKSINPPCYSDWSLCWWKALHSTKTKYLKNIKVGVKLNVAFGWVFSRSGQVQWVGLLHFGEDTQKWVDHLRGEPELRLGHCGQKCWVVTAVEEGAERSFLLLSFPCEGTRTGGRSSFMVQPLMSRFGSERILCCWGKLCALPGFIPFPLCTYPSLQGGMNLDRIAEAVRAPPPRDVAPAFHLPRTSNSSREALENSSSESSDADLAGTQAECS